MAMTFYEKFKKYAPTDAEREILDHITAFTPKVDVENRYISVMRILTPTYRLTGSTALSRTSKPCTN